MAKQRSEDGAPEAPDETGAQPERRRALSPAARRALAEAEARRAEQRAREAELAGKPEIDGREGPDPVRYGDWEKKGLASDF